MHTMLIYDFIDTLIQFADIYLFSYFCYDPPYLACALTVTKRKGSYFLFFFNYRILDDNLSSTNFVPALSLFT